MFMTKCAGNNFNDHHPCPPTHPQAASSENLYAAKVTEVNMIMDKIYGT
jgi:hypothetical protein